MLDDINESKDTYKPGVLSQGMRGKTRDDIRRNCAEVEKTNLRKQQSKGKRLLA